MTKVSYIPERGHAIWINFTPQIGHEQEGHRPAIVMSPALYNGKVGLALLCPITSQIKGYPFEVKIPDGLAISGVILSDQVKNLDWRARDTKFICSLPEKTINEALQKLGQLLQPTRESSKYPKN